jgi:hypothetical protein
MTLQILNCWSEDYLNSVKVTCSSYMAFVSVTGSGFFDVGVVERTKIFLFDTCEATGTWI